MVKIISEAVTQGTSQLAQMASRHKINLINLIYTDNATKQSFECWVLFS